MHASDESQIRIFIVLAACGSVVTSVATPFMIGGKPFEWDMLVLPLAGALFGVLLPISWALLYKALTLLRDLMEPLMNWDPIREDRLLTWRESIRIGVTVFVCSFAPFVALALLLRWMNN